MARRQGKPQAIRHRTLGAWLWARCFPRPLLVSLSKLLNLFYFSWFTYKMGIRIIYYLPCNRMQDDDFSRFFKISFWITVYVTSTEFPCRFVLNWFKQLDLSLILRSLQLSTTNFHLYLPLVLLLFSNRTGGFRWLYITNKESSDDLSCQDCGLQKILWFRLDGLNQFRVILSWYKLLCKSVEITSTLFVLGSNMRVEIFKPHRPPSLYQFRVK